MDPDDSQAVEAAIEDSLQTDPGLNSLLQSIVGYSPTIYDAAITDASGRALLHTDSDVQGKLVPSRPDFESRGEGRFPRADAHRVRQAAGVRSPPSAEPRRQALRPDPRRAFHGLSEERTAAADHARAGVRRALPSWSRCCWRRCFLNFALRPLEAIGQRLDRMTGGEIEPVAANRPARYDEYGLVTTKIDRLGQQMRDVKEVFSALKGNLDQIMGNLQDGLMLFTQDARVVLVSASAEQFVGRERSQILGCGVTDIFTRHTRLGRTVLEAFEQHRPVEQREVAAENGRRVQVSIDFIEEGGEQDRGAADHARCRVGAAN